MFSNMNPMFTYLDGERWRIECALVWRRSISRVTVPAGFETDFASVPRVLWNIIPPLGQHGLAAVLHDYLYATGISSRAEADAIFLESMRQLGVRFTRRYAMYLGVRLGGWLPWRRYRQQAKESI